jgi:hypothetical protein
MPPLPTRQPHDSVPVPRLVEQNFSLVVSAAEDATVIVWDTYAAALASVLAQSVRAY